MNNIKMLYNGTIYFSEEMNVNKTSKSRKCLTCHCRYFLNKWFKFQPNVFNGCHYLLMMSLNLSNIVILNLKSTDYCCIISGSSKSETINIMQNVDLNEKNGTL